MDASESTPILDKKRNKEEFTSDGTPNNKGTKTRKPKAIYQDMTHSDGAKELQRNFIAMTIMLALNHACMILCLVYASAELGNDLASIASGTFYAAFSIVAIFFSRTMIALCGSKVPLLISTFGCSIYVAGFFFSLVFLDQAWNLSIYTAGIGGACSGFLWAAQGQYFWRSCKLYSLEANVEMEEAQLILGRPFPVIFISIEIFLKIITTVYFVNITDITIRDKTTLFSIYALLANIACISMLTLKNVDSDLPDIQINADILNVIVALRLLYEDRKFLSYLPLQAAFGFASSYIPFYVFGTIVTGSTNFGHDKYIGLLSALVVATAAASAWAIAYCTTSNINAMAIVIGGICLALSGLLLVQFDDYTMGRLDFLIPYLLLYGIGRGLWEGTNKIVISEYFARSADKFTGSFALITFINGFAASMGYFSFYYFHPHTIEIFIFYFSMLSVICYSFGYCTCCYPVNDVFHGGGIKQRVSRSRTPTIIGR